MKMWDAVGLGLRKFGVLESSRDLDDGLNICLL